MIRTVQHNYVNLFNYILEAESRGLCRKAASLWLLSRFGEDPQIKAESLRCVSKRPSYKTSGPEILYCDTMYDEYFTFVTTKRRYKCGNIANNHHCSGHILLQ